MKPGIGRIVIWKNKVDTDYPAIITRVWSDQCVNVGVFSSGYFEVTSVNFGEQENEWRWPPRVE